MCILQGFLLGSGVFVMGTIAYLLMTIMAPSGSKGHASKRNTSHDGAKRLLLGGTRILHHAGHQYLCQLAYTSSFLKPYSPHYC